MRIWLSKNSEVSLRDQLITQVTLGIVSNDLKAGQKLPSTRELARRFDVHPNTVSTAYRELARRGWVNFRKGSGVYVSDRTGEIPQGDAFELDQLISTLFKLARERGYSIVEIQERVKHWLKIQPPDRFLLIEPDEELRWTLAIEINEATRQTVDIVGLDGCTDPARLSSAVPITMNWRADAVRSQLPQGTDCILLHSRSIAESLQGQKIPPPDSLIFVVSRWPEFLTWTHKVLAATGMDLGTINFRDAKMIGWDRGLTSSSFIITDSYTARKLPDGCDVRIFRIISDSSIAELRNAMP